MLKPRSISKRNRYHPLSTKVVPVNLFAKSIQIPSQYLSPRSRRLHAVPWFTLDSTAITRLDHQEKRELNERNGETIKRNCPNVVDRGRGRGEGGKGGSAQPPPRDPPRVWIARAALRWARVRIPRGPY